MKAVQGPGNKARDGQWSKAGYICMRQGPGNEARYRQARYMGSGPKLGTSVWGRGLGMRLGNCTKLEYS